MGGAQTHFMVGPSQGPTKRHNDTADTKFAMTAPIKIILDQYVEKIMTTIVY